ncbi:MAG TPA: translation elongation factor Ts [Bdellovibrionales bacterium]|nr:translation elongation factor Ts [Bdellovibrionales bacterium]
MSISATMVRELREKTNAGMMDCKKALMETGGDFEKAIDWLRAKGLSAAAKKSGRIAAEGAVTAQSNGKVGVLAEINSETDFVARNDDFKAFVKEVAAHVTNNPAGDILTQKWAGGSTVEEKVKQMVATIGENIVVRRTLKYELTGEGYIHTYVHGEGKIGVMVEVGGKDTPDLRAFAADVCLHIAAMNPMAISADQMPADVVAKEKEVLRAKNLEAGKKADMIDKIVEGQIRKFLAESCLLDQAFVKNPDLKVGDYMKETAKKTGGEVSLKRFARFELGEGIEKKVEDFAAEVAAQMKN